MDKPEIDDEKVKKAVPIILKMLAKDLDLDIHESISVSGSVVASLVFMLIRRGDAICDLLSILMGDIHDLIHAELEEVGLDSDGPERSEHLSQVIKSLKLENLK